DEEGLETTAYMTLALSGGGLFAPSMIEIPLRVTCLRTEFLHQLTSQSIFPLL
ncbi:hypothetical protein Ciccas_009961, partial [Cichlidogyrus casuarinus]